MSYEDGKETGRFSLTTAGEAIQLCMEADRTVLAADGEDLSFITIKLTDETGTENLSASKKVTVSVEGAGRLEGFGSADPSCLGSYDDMEWETYDGYVMGVVRAGEEDGHGCCRGLRSAVRGDPGAQHDRRLQRDWKIKK